MGSCCRRAAGGPTAVEEALPGSYAAGLVGQPIPSLGRPRPGATELTEAELQEIANGDDEQRAAGANAELRPR